jgi:hypothetical protein
MRTRALMTASAVYLGLAGAGATFMSEELLTHVRQPAAPVLMFFVQAVGALNLGFAMLNWMSRGATFGGIYGRPIVTANLLHFLMVALVLIRWAMAGAPPGILGLTAVYTVFAAWFGAVLLRDPVPGQSRGA